MVKEESDEGRGPSTQALDCGEQILLIVETEDTWTQCDADPTPEQREHLVRRIANYLMRLMGNNEPRLVTLDEAIAPYPGLSLHTIRTLIRHGRLPASKIGRAYFVDPADVEACFAPKLRPAAPRPPRESPSARADRQLAGAGIVSR